MADEPKKKSSVQDEAVGTLTTVEGEPARSEYTVTSRHGLFKSGKQYDKGEVVMLDTQTAANFIANGDIADPEAQE